MSKQKIGLKEFFKFYKDNSKAFRAYPLRDKSKSTLTLANIEIAKLDVHSPMYRLRVQEFNDAMVFHYTGKWYATEALRANNKETWRKAFQAFNDSLKISEKLLQYLLNGKDDLIEYMKPEIAKQNEIYMYHDVPLVPEITPIVILEGDSFAMGYQYAEQLVEIYGEWMIERHSKRLFTEQELQELLKWEAVHKKYTPEVLEFAKGWARYAIDHGYDLSYEHVIDLWVGHKPPTDSYLNAESGIPDLPPLACSALAAWSTATQDGALIVGATGDHDMSYQITIVMYPDDGSPLIFTPFEATGTLPTVGPNWFFGHPGMNKAGLAYVHHGGGPKMLEPRSFWGYGIRRGASVFHNLRYLKNAEEVKQQELNWPIGDIGYGDQATVGGFYADKDYGYIIESRKEPVCIREAGILNEDDYLFSNNSVMHPDAIKSEWMSKISELMTWDKLGGWRPKKPTGMTKSLGMIFKWFTGRLKSDELMSRGMMFSYWNSYKRNVFLNTLARNNFGNLTTDAIKAIYRTSGTMPQGDFKTSKKRYVRDGSWGQISAAHASNALVVVMKPDEGLYSLCTGPAIRGAASISPDLAISIWNERNSFWDIRLLDTPAQMVESARVLAKKLADEACDIAIKNIVKNQPLLVYKQLQAAIQEASAVGDEKLNKLIRCYTRMHVLARQFINFFNEPSRYDYPIREK